VTSIQAHPVVNPLGARGSFCGRKSDRHENVNFQDIMKMEAAGSSETMLCIYIITRFNLPQGSIFMITVMEI
jgi:hypothetical protein